MADAFAAIERIKARILGRLKVTCTPPAASIDAGDLGTGGCPFERGKLPPGPVSLTVSAPGRVPWTGTLQISPGRTLEKHIELIARPARLSVRCDVPVCRVFLDDAELGAGPLDGAVIEPGHHRVRVDAPSVPSWRAAVVVEPGGEVSLHARLRATQGSLSVRSRPPGAEVQLDGAPVGSTPIGSLPVAVGDHRLAVRAPGYVPWDEGVSVRDGEAVEVEVSLREAVGSLELLGTPAGAVVHLDGVPAGRVPLVVGRIRAGLHAVQVSGQGYRPWSTRVEVPRGERVRLTVDLEPGAGGTGDPQDPIRVPPGGTPGQQGLAAAGWTALGAAGWAAVGVAAASLVGATVAWRRAEGFYDEADESVAAYGSSRSAVAGGHRFNAVAAQEDGDSALRVAQVLAVAGAVAGAAGATLLVVPRLRAAAAPVPGGVVVRASW